MVLTFPDTSLEKEFREYAFRAHLNQTRFACLLGFVTAFAYLPIDPLFVNEEASSFIRTGRIYFMLPFTLGWFVMSYFLRDGQFLQLAIAVVAPGVSWCFAVMTVIGGAESLYYGGIAIMQVSLFIVLLLRLPFSLSLPSLVVSIVPFYTVIFWVDASLSQRLNPILSVTFVSLLAALSTFQAEFDQRRGFLAERENERWQVEKDRLDNERLQWLQIAVQFLRHELRNALVGVSSSIELLQRHVVDPGLMKYVTRAKNGTNFMREMFNRTAAVTSLEAALREEDFEIMELGGLIKDAISGYQTAYPSHQINLNIGGAAIIRGNPTRLIEMFEKIMDNAITHSEATLKIFVTLSSSADKVDLIIKNQGDPLPEETEGLFDLFVSGSERTKADHSNLGLGLYVAKTIVEHHGGSIAVRPAADIVGAEFHITFPTPA